MNDHGQDWILALLFTLWVWIFSYTVFITPHYLFWRVFFCLLTSGVLVFIFKCILDNEKKCIWKIDLYLFYIVTFYILTSYNLQIINLTDYFKGLVVYFIPTNYNQLIGENAYLTGDMNYIKIFGVIVYILGKLLIIFGGYELIRAFRKYNKI
ncbi:MAG: hypothetical protein ACRCR9_03860 [Chitinophagaceae bacterium]